MLATIDLRDFHPQQSRGGYRGVVPRAGFDVEAAVPVVRPVIDAVAERGEKALAEFSQQFDHVVPAQFRVPEELFAAAVDELDEDLRAAFEVAIQRRRTVCRSAEVELSPDPVQLADGAIVLHRLRPVNRVGLYVPGGLAPLASSVLMNVVAAQEAGVQSLALASPPQLQFGGWPHPNVLALCQMLGVHEVFAVGGAQAMAMFAHGVDGLCDPVDMITGPGNIYVVAAKRALQGIVGIDSEAGPTEVAILADETADPELVAADLVSQSEHDPLAAAVLVTTSTQVADRVNQDLRTQVAQTLHRDRVSAALSGEQSAIVLVRDLEQGLAVVDDYGAEHLEIHTADAASLAARVNNAGAIFVGSHSPVSLGDYSAGSTHVLPTAGAARYSSGLTVRSFIKTTHVIEYSPSALAEIADGIQKFAIAENLPAHANAVAIRRATALKEAPHEP